MPPLIDSPLGPGKANTTRSRGEGRSLAPGNEVRATVGQVLPDGRALLNMMGRTLSAESESPLQPGQSLRLIVEQLAPRLVLSLADGDEKTAAMLGRALADLAAGDQPAAKALARLMALDIPAELPPGPAREAAAQLQDLLSRMLPQGEKAADAAAWEEALRALPTNSGQNLEALLARGQTPPPNVRGLALVLEPRLEALALALEAADPEKAEQARRIAADARQVGNMFEANAKLNSQLLPQEYSMVLMLPILLGGLVRHGEVFFGYEPPEGQRQKHGEVLSLIFYLDLASLGPLVVEAQVAGKMIKADFIVDSPPKKSYLAGRLDELSQALSRAGYEAFLAAQARPPHELEPRAPLTRLAVGRRGGYLSVTV